MSLDDLVQKNLDDPNEDDIGKENIRSIMASGLVKGMMLQRQGLLHQAIEEFAKESNRTIYTDIDKEIAQKSYVQIGVAYRKLGEIDNAKAAFEKARELWNQYNKGTAPHYYLAEILIEKGWFDEAISVCREILDQIPDRGANQILAKALAMKKGKSE